ncbi:hypothetical protein J7S78_13990 [Klebsiella oxytoca]|uniref:Uncharacterized protein n=1 Tax=Klebsiella oxytoca TaxID=571 RepID=A0AAP2BJV9_KLEOX|nr:hypothetical protein [Klebsiella oxytoca]MBQ0600905.1 hypothetical protein [Klebsiella oxytoca]
MAQPDLDLLIESEQMRTILLSLKQLSAQSDGVMVNGEVISWDNALPLLNAFPDFVATRQKKDEWMGIAATTWESDYHESVKKIVSRSISENSSLENDNLYLWSLLNATEQIMRRFLKYVNKKELLDAEPNSLRAAKDVLVALESVISGAQSTARIRNELFLSGIDTVSMEFQRLYTIAKKDGRDEDSALYVCVLTTIRKLKEQTMKDLGK